MDESLIKFCIENGLPFVITFDKPWINTPLEEYNTDTSAQHPSKGEDIVRPILNNEGIELEDKEPLG